MVFGVLAWQRVFLFSGTSRLGGCFTSCACALLSHASCTPAHRSPAAQGLWKEQSLAGLLGLMSVRKGIFPLTLLADVSAARCRGLEWLGTTFRGAGVQKDHGDR